MASLDQSTLEAVNNSNYKVMAEQTALIANTQAQNAAANQQAMWMVQQASVAAAIKNLTELDPAQAISIGAAIDSRLAPLVGALTNLVAMSQIQMKGAQTTPPVTS